MKRRIFGKWIMLCLLAVLLAAAPAGKTAAEEKSSLEILLENAGLLAQDLDVEELREYYRQFESVIQSDEFQNLIEYEEVRDLITALVDKGVDFAIEDPDLAQKILITAGMDEKIVSLLPLLLEKGSKAGEALEQTDLKGMTALLVRLYAELLAIYVYLSHMLPVFLASVVFYKGYLKAKFKRGDMVLLTIAILSVGAMILTPHYPNRAIFGTCAFLLILAIRLITREREAIPFLMRRIAVLLLWAAGIYRMLIYYFE